MRKYILLLCTICMGLVSCVKENMSGIDADGLTTFRAVYADASTKTVLDGLTPMWTPEDKISIYDGVNNEFSNALTAPAATAEFKGKLAGKGRTHYLAASPYNADLTFSLMGLSVYSLQIPEQQNAVAGSYDPSAAVAVAYSKTSSLEFRNVCSLVKFKIVSDDVKAVTLVPHGEKENLAGVFNATIDTEIRITVIEGKETVTLNGDFKKDETYYLVTLPASLKSGFKVLLKTAAGGYVESMNFTNPVDFERSGMINLGDLSLDPKESTLPDDPGQEEEPEEGVVYFAPTSDWTAGGAHVAAYFWQDGMEEEWVNMTEDVEEGVYKCEVPEGYGNIIFVSIRSGAENNWDNKLVQTVDLTVPADENVCFVPTGKDAEGKVSGEWTAYPPENLPVDPNPGNPGEEIETAGTIYLRPNSNWLEAGARFAVYFFELGKPEVWMSMTEDVEENVYKTEVPAGYTNVIFVRMNPDVSENRWNNENDVDPYKPVWGQTADLLVPTGDNVCYVITPGTWGEDGYWTTYPPVITEPTPDPDPDPTPDPTPDPGVGENDQVIYLNAGGSGLWDQAGAWFEVWSWPTGGEGKWYTMSSDGSGLYSVTVPKANTNIIFVRRGPDMTQGWDAEVHYWNKTDDLAIPDGMNCYTITGWGGTDGTWSAL